ncbi:hypothetical protein GUJ93_ZPchr0005g15171 [Zizania palustris]|uniref:Uncharacterized protein n=1 Tax=Zizania palustris TaxID=103762 RepID=A0A8J5W154_ZIZPA|nr:hypothetical protein GUJ93_ZPchr0005g15171 [Zizania palustris]
MGLEAEPCEAGRIGAWGLGAVGGAMRAVEGLGGGDRRRSHVRPDAKGHGDSRTKAEPCKVGVEGLEVGG